MRVSGVDVVTGVFVILCSPDVISRQGVALVLQRNELREVEFFSDQVPQPVGSLRVVGVRVPEADDVIIRANRDDGTAYVVGQVAEVLADNREQQFLPVQRGQSLLGLAESHDPLAAVLVSRIFPGRRDALAKQVVISHAPSGNAARLDEVIVYAKETVDRVERTDLYDRRGVIL